MGQYDGVNINELVQGSLGSSSATITITSGESTTGWWYQKAPHSMACEILCKSRCKLSLLTCNLLHGGIICSDETNNIMLETANGNFILNC